MSFVGALVGQRSISHNIQKYVPIGSHRKVFSRRRTLDLMKVMSALFSLSSSFGSHTKPNLGQKRNYLVGLKDPSIFGKNQQILMKTSCSEPRQTKQFIHNSKPSVLFQPRPTITCHL